MGYADGRKRTTGAAAQAPTMRVLVLTGRVAPAPVVLAPVVLAPVVLAPGGACRGGMSPGGACPVALSV